MAHKGLKPLKTRHWDAEKAEHLLSRAGFGIPRERVRHLERIGLFRAVDSLVDFGKIPEYGVAPGFLLQGDAHRRLRDIKDEAERRKARQKLQRSERQAMQLMKQWWFERILNSPRPLEEKLTLFWHGHFATSAQKVKSSHYNYQLNSIFRRFGTGSFRTLTMEVARSPAMLRYLDNVQNVAAHPNENWARELMELFTMGIGNYTEKDIKESARAFTGWAVGPRGFTVRQRQHDVGKKEFLGRSGNLGGREIIDTIFEQNVTAEFISRKLYRFFVSDDVDEDVVRAMAEDLRENGYVVGEMLRSLFRSEDFYAKGVIGSQIKSPVQFVVQLVHDLGLPYPPYASMARSSAQLGQNLFYPPNVKGWDGGRSWINTNTLLTRYNLPVSLANANGKGEMDRMAAGMDGNLEMMQPKNTAAEKREEIESFMAGLSYGDRTKVRKQMRSMKSGDGRRRYMERLLQESEEIESWDVKSVLDEIEFKTAQECVDGLMERFLAVPLARDQQELIAKALGAKSGLEQKLSNTDIKASDMTAALHLLLSTAEYQLA